MPTRRLPRRAGTLVLVATLGALAGCAGRGASASPEPTISPSSAPARRTDFNVITAEDMQPQTWTDAYQLVESLRPRWLQSRGTDSFGTPGEVQVHLNENRLGGVQALRSIPVTGIVYLQFYPPSESAALWGLNHSHGTILVSTHPR